MHKLDLLKASLESFKELLQKDSANPKLAPKETKIKKLQQQIDAGTYKPDPKKIASSMIASVAKEEVEYNKHGQWSMTKSNYGPKGAKQYNPVDNAKRKATRTTEERPVGPNTAVRQYTTAPMGSAKEQAAAEASKYRAKSRKNPVKVYSDEEKKKLAEARGLKPTK